MPEPGATGSGVGAGMAGGGIGAEVGMDAAELDAGAGGYSSANDLAGALADALAGANVDDFGAYAAQDVQNIEDQGMAFNEQQASERQALADRIAQIDAAIAGSAQATGPAGTGAASNPFVGPATGVVDDFSGGNFGLTGPEQFADWGAPTPTSIEETQMGMAAPMFGQTATAGTDFFGNQDPTEGYVFGQSSGQQGDPTLEQYSGDPTFSSDTAWKTSPQASPYGAMSELGLTGHQFAMGNPIGYAGPYNITTSQNVEDQLTGGGAAAVDSFTNMPLGDPGTMATEQFDSGIAGESGATQGQGGVSMSAPLETGQGLISQVSSGPMESTGSQGAITAGQYGEMDEGTLDPNAGGVSAPAASPAGTDFFGDDGNVGQATDSPAGTRMTQKEVNVYGKYQVDKSIAVTAEHLAYLAKTDPNGIAIKNTNITNRRMSKAFNSLNQYSKAYAAMNGGSFLGSLIEGAVPFGAAFKAFEGWLTSKGMYSKEMGQDLLKVMKTALDTGDLNEIVRELSGGGPSDEDVEGPKEVRSFIEQYPWAAELDPKYIKYLIDNPAALQDLLGQGPGGGDQETQGV